MGISFKSSGSQHGIFVDNQGTGLLPYIRPLHEIILLSRALMKSARFVIVDVTIYYNHRRVQVFNTPVLPVLSSSTFSLRNFGWDPF